LVVGISGLIYSSTDDRPPLQAMNRLPSRHVRYRTGSRPPTLIPTTMAWICPRRSVGASRIPESRNTARHSFQAAESARSWTTQPPQRWPLSVSGQSRNWTEVRGGVVPSYRARARSELAPQERQRSRSGSCSGSTGQTPTPRCGPGSTWRGPGEMPRGTSTLPK